MAFVSGVLAIFQVHFTLMWISLPYFWLIFVPQYVLIIKIRYQRFGVELLAVITLSVIVLRLFCWVLVDVIESYVWILNWWGYLLSFTLVLKDTFVFDHYALFLSQKSVFLLLFYYLLLFLFLLKLYLYRLDILAIHWL